MNYGRADPARVGLLALAAAALVLAFVIPQITHRTHSAAAGVGATSPVSRPPSVVRQSQIDNRQSTIDNGAAAPRLVASYGRLPLSFEANRGQTDGQVKFLSRGRGYTLFLTGNEAVLSLRSQKSGVRSQPPTARNSKSETGNWPIWNLPSEISNRQSLLGHPTDYGPRTTDRALLSIDNRQPAINNSSDKAPTVLRMTLVGANANAKVTGMNPLPGKSNYFLGNDPKKWRTNVPTYAKVKYKGVYPGIDLVYYGNQRQLEYDFVVAPGADPHAIAFEIDGAVAPVSSPAKKSAMGTSPLQIDPSGDLVISAGAGELRFRKPVVYQPNPESRNPNPGFSTDNGRPTTDSSFNLQSSIVNHQSVDGRFVLLADNRVGFDIGAYDKTLPLIIDPVLSYSTYLGGSGNLGERVRGIAVDASGNAYLTGYTDSADFPTTLGAFQRTIGGGFHGFVTKLNATGSALVYSTFLGGSVEDLPQGIAVDSDGNAYLTGSTLSPDFPTTPGAFQTTFQGGGNVGDAFVTKLNSLGSALVYSTFLAGDGRDVGLGIALDSSGGAYVAGWTESANFPTLNPFQATCNACVLGTPDAFVTKLNPDGTGVLYSTYLGGSGSDWRAGIAVDASGSIYVAGSTTSTNFPTASPFQAALAGNADAFLTKFSPDGSALVYSTYLGGVGNDYVGGFAVDASGHAYIAGDTDSTNFPVVNAFQPQKGAQRDVFVSKFTPAGTALAYSTYLGGNNDDNAQAFAIDPSNRAWVTGFLQSTNFPTVDPIQANLNGIDDAFLTVFDPSGSQLAFSTYLGGSGEDGGYALATDLAGNGYLAGRTWSTDFPTTPGAFQTVRNGDSDAFVAKVTPPPLPGPALSLSATTLTFGDQPVGSSSAPQTVTLSNPGSSALILNSIALGVGTDFAQTNDCPVAPATLDSGGSCTLSVTFSPTAEGAFNDQVVITSDAPGSPHHVALAGNGVPPAPAVNLSPDSVNFGDQLVGTTSPTETVTLRNSGSAVLDINSITESGAFDQTNTCPLSPATLGVEAECVFTITFTPTDRGVRSGAITIVDDAAGSPHTVNLTGNGVIAAQVDLSAMSLIFGGQLIGTTSAEQTVTLTNTGDLTLGNVAITHAGDFAHTTTCGSTVAGGASCTIGVTFTPTATGDLSGSVTITDDTPGGQHTVTLSGTGTDFSLSSDPTSREITAGASPSYTLSVSPVSGFNQSVALSCTKPAALTLATCSVSPSAVTPDGTNAATATVTVTTTARGMAAPQGPVLPPIPRPWAPLVLPLMLAMWAALLLAAKSRTVREQLCATKARFAGHRPALQWAPPVAATMLCVLLWAACGGGGNGGPPPSQPGTPAGTYTLTLTGTVGSVSRQTTVSLTVN